VGRYPSPGQVVFFVTDKIKRGEVKVAFCPTHNMIEDFFTKNLQGNQLMDMRYKILNLPGGTCTAMHRSVLEKANLNEEIKVDKKNLK